MQLRARAGRAEDPPAARERRRRRGRRRTFDRGDGTFAGAFFFFVFFFSGSAPWSLFPRLFDPRGSFRCSPLRLQRQLLRVCSDLGQEARESERELAWAAPPNDRDARLFFIFFGFTWRRKAQQRKKGRRRRKKVPSIRNVCPSDRQRPSLAPLRAPSPRSASGIAILTVLQSLCGPRRRRRRQFGARMVAFVAFRLLFRPGLPPTFKSRSSPSVVEALENLTLRGL